MDIFKETLAVFVVTKTDFKPKNITLLSPKQVVFVHKPDQTISTTWPRDQIENSKAETYIASIYCGDWVAQQPVNNLHLILFGV